MALMGREMAFFFFFFFFLLVVTAFSSLVQPSAGEVYTVGDNAGWTILGNINYSSWAASRKFKVGDKLVFVYNKQFHNVLQVSKSDWRSCNAASPLTTYTSGNDTVILRRKGHYFFICGFPGHCVAGQSVDIRVPKTTSVSSTPDSAPSASPSKSPSSPVSAPAPGPGSSNAAPASKGLGLALALVAVVVSAEFYLGIDFVVGI